MISQLYKNTTTTFIDVVNICQSMSFSYIDRNKKVGKCRQYIYFNPISKCGCSYNRNVYGVLLDHG